jgi:hypothetical protein
LQVLGNVRLPSDSLAIYLFPTDEIELSYSKQLARRAAIVGKELHVYINIHHHVHNRQARRHAFKLYVQPSSVEYILYVGVELSFSSTRLQK